MTTIDGKPPTSSGSLVYLTLICLVATLGGLLFGYDTAVINGAVGFLQTHFALDSTMKGWATSSALLGCFFGVAIAGVISDRFGRRNTLTLSAVLFLVSAIGTAVPRTFAEFVIFRFIGGLGVGAASMTSPMYIAEISPARIRGRMVSVNQLAIVTGMLVVFFVNYLITAYGVRTDRPWATSAVRRVSAELADRGVTVDENMMPKIAEIMVSGIASSEFQTEGPQYIEGKLSDLEELKKEVATALVDPIVVEMRKVQAWNVRAGWRWMFGSESLPALALLVLLFFVPESPRWLTKQGRPDEARRILTRVDGPDHAASEMAEITNAIARESGSVTQLFLPGMRIVLIIGTVLAVLQQVTGINVFLYYGAEIFKSMAGATVDAALLQQIVIGSANLSFTIIAIWTVDRIGRKPLMMIGALGMGISLAALGLAAFFDLIGASLLVFVLGYIACFALSGGPVTWVILSEVFPTKIRGRAMAIATCCLWLANFAVSQTFPMIDENPWLVKQFNHGFPFWLYAIFCAVLFLFVWRAVPETKGKTLEEIEQHWTRQ